MHVICTDSITLQQTQQTLLLDLDHIPAERIAAQDSEGNSVTYGEICRRTERLKTQFADRQLCFLLVDNSAEAVAVTMAMLCSGIIVPLILNVKTDRQLLDALISTYRPQLICSATDGFALKPTGEAQCTMHDEMSHLLPTSGSTGSPKLVRHKYDNIEAAALNISTFFELKETDRPLLVLPLYYTMGLSVVFSHLKVGATVLITGRSMTDAAFWKFMKEECATSFTGVPYSYQILDMMRFTRMQLPHMELLTQGGGKMPTELNLKFAQFCQDNGKRWIATYGQSECTARMAWLPPKWAIEKAGSIGIAVPNGELSLIDTEGNEITTTEGEGEMCYRGKNVTMGYAVRQEDLALGDERKGYIRTGDIARRDKDGCYYIVGRMSRFLKLFGMRIGLDECELIVQNNTGTECACVGTDQKMIVYITDESKTDAVKQVLVDKTHIVASSFEVRTIKEIPKNEAGKKLFKLLPDK